MCFSLSNRPNSIRKMAVNIQSIRHDHSKTIKVTRNLKFLTVNARVNIVGVPSQEITENTDCYHPTVFTG